MDSDIVELHVTTTTSADAPIPDDRIFQSLHEAARAASRISSGGHPVNIIIHPGTYPVGQSLTLSPNADGNVGAPVTWKAKESGTAILSGSIPLNGFSQVSDPSTLDRLRVDNF